MERMSQSTEQYEKVKEDARRLMGSLSGLFGEKVDEGRSHLQEMSTTARTQLRSAGNMAREKGKEVDMYARDHVWMTAMVSAVIGVVVGALLGRKRN